MASREALSSRGSDLSGHWSNAATPVKTTRDHYHHHHHQQQQQQQVYGGGSGGGGGGAWADNRQHDYHAAPVGDVREGEGGGMEPLTARTDFSTDSRSSRREAKEAKIMQEWNLSDPKVHGGGGV